MRITVARLSFRYALGSRVTDPIRYTPVPILPTVLLRLDLDLGSADSQPAVS